MKPGSDRPDRTHRVSRRTVGVCVVALGDGLLLFSLVQVLGTVLSLAIRRHAGPGLALPLPALVVGLSLAWVGASLRGTERIRRRGVHAALSLLLLAVTLPAVLRPWLIRSDYVRAAGLDVYVYPASHTEVDCWGGRGCNEYAINAFGLRGAVPDPAGLHEAVVAMVGDSYTFGMGVADGSTVVEALQRRLVEEGYDVAALNLGIPGLAAPSFAGMVRYGARIVLPTVVVVLLKDDDIAKSDLSSRLRALEDSVLARLIVLTAFDAPCQVVGLVRTRWFGNGVTVHDATAWLDEIASAAGRAGVVLVTDLGDPVAEEALDAWLPRHPSFTRLDVRPLDAWRTAPRIPGDGHFTAAGNEQVAALLAPTVAAALDKLRAP